MGTRLAVLCSVIAGTLATMPASALTPFTFSTGDPDGKIAAASRPDSGGKFEIESADDFVLTDLTSIDHITFTGLIPAAAAINQVRVEFYRVFPQDSDVARTSGPPTFSTAQVPTRVNSPSDVAFVDADSAVPSLTFMTTLLGASFTTLNSLMPGGIHPIPGQTTGGNGPVTGMEVQFDVVLTPPIVLPRDHYFFIPQVAVSGGEFFWLSAPKPIVAPGTPFPAGSRDLQSWTRDAFLDPDWLRIGTDIGGGAPAPTFNATFSLAGQVVVSFDQQERAGRYRGWCADRIHAGRQQCAGIEPSQQRGRHRHPAGRGRLQWLHRRGLDVRSGPRWNGEMCASQSRSQHRGVANHALGDPVGGRLADRHGYDSRRQTLRQTPSPSANTPGKRRSWRAVCSRGSGARSGRTSSGPSARTWSRRHPGLTFTAFLDRARAGDYDHLRRVVMQEPDVLRSESGSGSQSESRVPP